MNIQLYLLKKNFDVQKALRFFKERGVAVTQVDMKKHRPGPRELRLFAEKNGVRALLNTDDPKVREHPIAYTANEEKLLEMLCEHPEFLVTPLIRDGRRAMAGFDQSELLRWIGDK